MDSRKAKGLDTFLPFLLPWQQAVRQRTQWGICFGSKSQKHKSPWRQGGRAAGGRHGSRRRDHVFNHVYKAERANRKRGEVTNSTHSDFCPSARWHPSPVSLAGKQMFKYLKPWKAFLIKPLHCEIKREQEKKTGWRKWRRVSVAGENSRCWRQWDGAHLQGQHPWSWRRMSASSRAAWATQQDSIS